MTFRASLEPIKGEHRFSELPPDRDLSYVDLVALMRVTRGDREYCRSPHLLDWARVARVGSSWTFEGVKYTRIA